MVSKFEDVLLRSQKDKKYFRKTLFEYLDDGFTLHRLRIVSRTLRDLIDHSPGRLFRQLYVNAPLPAFADTRSLQTIAIFCHSLTIKVGYEANMKRSSVESTASASSSELVRRSQDLMKSFWEKKRIFLRGSNARSSLPSFRSSSDSIRLSSTDFRASVPPAQLPDTERRMQLETKERWAALLSHFRQLTTLTLRVNGNPVWPGRTEVEDTLVTIRIALEYADLSSLRTLCLAPIHAMGIIHLRWLGLGAFGESLAPGAAVWLNINTLDLRVHNPFAGESLTKAQEVMFLKILYDYLRSFAPSLRCLRFVWLGGNGPSPMTLHLEPDLIRRRQELKWPKLEELWFGNVQIPHQTIRLTPLLAPSVTRLKHLRSTRRESSMDANDSSAWVEVLGLRDSMQVDASTNRASSIYSQSAMTDGSAWAGGISRSSREIPFMLDI